MAVNTRRGAALPRPVARDGVPAHALADASHVRAVCGCSRPTLLTWRREKGFPPPLKVPNVSGEVWDLREVRAWLRAHRADAHQGAGQLTAGAGSPSN